MADNLIIIIDLKPILYRKHMNGEILIVGGVYDIYTGKVEFL